MSASKIVDTFTSIQLLEQLITLLIRITSALSKIACVGIPYSPAESLFGAGSECDLLWILLLTSGCLLK